MIEVRFRAWDKKSKKYRVIYCITYDTTWKFSKNPKISHINLWGRTFLDDGESNPDILISRKPNEIILEQFTGLKDKNGVEIYEGDILNYKTNKETNNWASPLVFKQENSFAVEFRNGCFVDDCERPISDWIINIVSKKVEFEVIGNIHQDKDLLESEVK